MKRELMGSIRRKLASSPEFFFAYRAYRAYRKSGKQAPGGQNVDRLESARRLSLHAIVRRLSTLSGFLFRQYDFSDLLITRNGIFFRNPWGAFFAYLPAWGAYLAEFGELHEAEELLLLDSLLPEGGNLLDVGANVGTHSINLACRRPDIRCFAFEPVPTTRGYLQANIEVNGLQDRIAVYGEALGEEEGECRITVDQYTDNRLLTNSAAAPTSGASTMVRVTTLDQWHEQEARPPISVLKMDVEGGELAALKGAEALLKRERPALLLEIVEEHLGRFGSSKRELFQWLSSIGYVARADQGGILPTNTLFVPSDGESGAKG